MINKSNRKYAFCYSASRHNHTIKKLKLLLTQLHTFPCLSSRCWCISTGTSAVFTLLFLPLGSHWPVCSITDMQISRLFGRTEDILYSLTLSLSKADEVKLLNILEFHNSWHVCSPLQENWRELEYNGPSHVFVHQFVVWECDNKDYADVILYAEGWYNQKLSK